jgi:hypothetical protein
MSDKKIKISILLNFSLVLVFSFITAFFPASAAVNDSMPNIKMPELQVNLPNFTSANFKAPTCVTTDTGVQMCENTWISEYIAAIYKYAISIVGILAAVVLMFGGLLWLTAGGNATRVGEAKAWIGASLTGLVIALTSYSILYQINPDLVSIKSISTAVVKEDISASDAQTYFTGGGGELGPSILPTDPTIRGKYATEIMKASQLSGIPPSLIQAFMLTESSGNPNAKSPAGALGLMQLMPDTAKSLGFDPSKLYDPQTSLNAGAAYIKQLYKTACNGGSSNAVCSTSDLKYIIAAYNGGPKANSVSKTCPGQTYWECSANNGYKETRKYVPKVMGFYSQLK